MAVKPPTNPKSMIADKNALREAIAGLAERLGIVPDPTLTPQKVREMMIADGIEASMLRLASTLPIHTPGHRRGPRRRSAARAIPEGGHSAVAYPGGIASSRANLAAPK